MSAVGGVRTFFTPAASRAAHSEQEVDGGSGVPQGPIEISSEEMSYHQVAAEVVYTGSVKVVQEESSLACEFLTIALDEDNEARNLTCEGAVSILDPQRGYTLQAGLALYDLGEQRVEVFGEPITMTDSEGNKVGGACRLTYSFLDESLVLNSCDDSRSIPEVEDV